MMTELLDWSEIKYIDALFSPQIADGLTSFVLISTAEIGDKSQLVCMSLAARHRAMPVLLGAILAFAFLNTLAVLFGTVLAVWLPEWLMTLGVSFMFLFFAIHTLLRQQEEEETLIKQSNRNILWSTFFLITLAELGDKTQLAVVALSGTHQVIPVWVGSTLALSLTSSLGVIAGRLLIRRVSWHLVHQISAYLFLALSGLAAYRTYLLLKLASPDYVLMLNNFYKQLSIW